ncbi:MAG: ExeA family protein [Gemmatimonas sp.]|jgi:type II secretory pathway predicted ATPase ExeA|uniref:ExeA family protein n=1 Tax=Gemmatimonas sp. TaxID=1962908 RepID=UPI00391F0DA5
MTLHPLSLTLKRLRLRQQDLAPEIGLSRPALTAVLNHGVWPVRVDRAQVCARLEGALRKQGATAAEIALSINAVSPAAAPATAEKDRPSAAANSTGPELPPTTTAEDPTMLLRRQVLTEAAKQRFGLPTNPFALEVESDEDLFQTPDVRYVREALMHAARNAGFLAVTGESGAGKSTIREDLIERLQRDRKEFVIIQPSTLGMDDSEAKGRPLTAGAIMDVICWALAPSAPAPATMQAKARRVERLLTESASTGNKHLLVIEEAHRLSKHAIRHLKGFHEIKSGRQRLLGIVLIGQPELRDKLSEFDPEVREVTQRCELVTLEPWDRHAKGYIEHRLARAGKRLADVMDDAAFGALMSRLTIGKHGDKSYRSVCYPLAINNLMTLALNAAASVDLSSINADVMRRSA